MNKKGYTLVELLIVLSIIVIAAVTPCFIWSLSKYVSRHGIKSTVESVWYGNNSNHK
jgi:prepilin-type N-terminal cleavage/methylation domain-containing protein